MLQAYVDHVAERAALGIPPLPLSARQTSEVIELMKTAAAKDGEFLLNLLTHRVPAGVDDAAKVKASYLAAVAHGTEKEAVLAHKAAIDRHLEEAGIHVGYTNVFWGGRSEIKPSEISPVAYARWCRSIGVDPESMR